MTDVGSTHSVIGGFWPASVCACDSDLNYDKKRNGLDVQGFVDCMLSGGANSGCADINQDGLLDSADTSLFVSGLLATTPCP